jgi:hypothetical protein
VPMLLALRERPLRRAAYVQNAPSGADDAELVEAAGLEP